MPPPLRPQSGPESVQRSAPIPQTYAHVSRANESQEEEFIREDRPNFRRAHGTGKSRDFDDNRSAFGLRQPGESEQSTSENWPIEANSQRRDARIPWGSSTKRLFSTSSDPRSAQGGSMTQRMLHTLQYQVHRDEGLKINTVRSVYFLLPPDLTLTVILGFLISAGCRCSGFETPFRYPSTSQ